MIKIKEKKIYIVNGRLRVQMEMYKISFCVVLFVAHYVDSSHSFDESIRKKTHSIANFVID